MLSSIKEIIKSDLYRYIKNTSFKNFIKVLNLNAGFRFIYFFRKASNYKKNSIRGFYYQFRLRILINKFGIQIYPYTKIGKGFYIGHFGTIVISPETIIGKNCNVTHGVTIGRTNRGKRKGYPKIGNSVWFGANSTVVGNIKIGNNVLIAPNAYVNFNVPDNAIVLGNPGKIIPNKKATEYYINNKIR